MNNKKINKFSPKILNKKGFTLVELLAIITILAIVFSISIYGISSVLSKTRNKTYEVTINNIESVAINYLTENSDSLLFINNSTEEYQCIQVQNLVDMGYFDSDITNSKISYDETVGLEDYIYIARDTNTKSITKTIYLNKNYTNYNSICSSAIEVTSNIRFVISPSGWSKSKNISIYYNLKNTLNSSNYQNNYQYKNKDNKLINSATDVGKNTTITINENGTIYAQIANKETNSNLINVSQTITKIDNDGPTISENYKGREYEYQNLTIPIIITDNESGVNGNIFNPDKVTVTVGGTTVSDISFVKSSATQYNLTINNNNITGKVEIKLLQNTVFDNVGNGNEEITLKPNLTIVKSAIIPTSSLCESKTYNGSVQQLTSTTTGTGYILSGYNQTNAGTYTITATLASEYIWTDYSTETKTFTCSISKATPTITLSSATTTYNGNVQTLATVNKTDVTVYYSVGTELTSSNYSTSGSTTIPSKTAAGTYKIYYYTQENTNYNSASGNISVTIAQKNLTITASDQTITYGNSITNNTSKITSSNLISGHSITSITLIQSTTSVTTSGKITPSAAVIKDGSNNTVTTNYNITYKTGTLTIKSSTLSTYKCYEVIASSGLFCRSGTGTNYSVKSTLYAYTYYKLIYSKDSGGYSWYYSNDKNCYVAGSSSSDKYISYYGTSCPSTGGNNNGNNNGSNNSCTYTCKGSQRVVGSSCYSKIFYSDSACRQKSNYCEGAEDGTWTYYIGPATCS